MDVSRYNLSVAKNRMFRLRIRLFGVNSKCLPGCATGCLFRELVKPIRLIPTAPFTAPIHFTNDFKSLRNAPFTSLHVAISLLLRVEAYCRSNCWVAPNMALLTHRMLTHGASHLSVGTLVLLVSYFSRRLPVATWKRRARFAPHGGFFPAPIHVSSDFRR